MTTDITVVLDRSGSMAAIAPDVIAGLNAFIAAQQASPATVRFTLVQFDDEYEVVHADVPMHSVPPLTDTTFVPRGSTALLDAIGRSIVDTAARIARLAPEARPAHVVFVVQTDGEENASRELTREQVFAMIRRQERVHGWQFLFLAANQDAIAEGGRMGFQPDRSIDFDASGPEVRATFSILADKIARAGRGQEASLTFDQRDRRRTKRRAPGTA